jgi:putative ABC transport system permease protein
VNTILLRKSARDLRRSLSQTIALIVIVALGVASFIALVGAYRDLDTSYDRTYKDLHFADATFAVDSFPETELGSIRDIKGVAAVTGRLIFDTGIELPKRGGKSVQKQARSRLIGVPKNHRPAVDNVFIEKGRYLSPADHTSVLVESHFAEYYGLEPGDIIKPIINGKIVKFTIAGLAASPEYLVVSSGREEIIPSASTFAVLYMPLAKLQALTGADDSVNNVAVTFKPGADQRKAIAEIKDRLRPYGLLETTLRKDQPSNAALKLDVDGFHEIAYIMPTLILLVALASVYMLLSRQVLAQRSQIGIAKALGYSNRSVVMGYLASALIIGLMGSVLGLIIGIPLADLITSSYAGELGIPLVQTRLYPDVMTISILFSLIVSALAGLGPARAAAKVAPAVAMHPDIAAVSTKGRVSLLERLLPLPLWFRLSLRSVFRVRRRAVSTILGIIFSLTLVLMAWGMINSMSYMINRNFDVVERWDEMVSFNSAVTTTTPLADIEGIKGVRSASAFMQLPTTVKANGEESDIFVTGVSPAQKMHILQLPPGLSAKKALADGKIVLNKAIAKKLKVERGDKVTVKTPLGTHKLTVGGTATELMSAVAYVSIDQVKKWADTGGPLYNSVYIKVDPGRADWIQTEIYRLPGVSGVRLESTTAADWRSLMGLFYSLIGFILLFALAMAFALLFNAVTINTLERLREFATMRAMGTGLPTISWFMLLEDFILWLIALVPGLALGWWATVQLGRTFESDIFYFQVVIFKSSYALSALGILAVMALATLPAVRRIRRLNLADETRVIG